jgi:hypothetical protein
MPDVGVGVVGHVLLEGDWLVSAELFCAGFPTLDFHQAAPRKNSSS